MRVEGTVDIGAPARLVFGMLSTPERLPEWNLSVKAVSRGESGPVQVGSRATAEGELLGQRIISETEVVTYEAPVRFATRAIKGPKLHTDFRVEQLPEGARVVATVEGQLPGGPLLGAVAESFIRGEFTRSLQRLKELCESINRASEAGQPVAADVSGWLNAG